MSNLSFIPSATASKQTRDFQQPSFSEKNLEFGANKFDQFLKSANEDQFKLKQFREKPEQIRLAESKAKPEPKKDGFKTSEQSRPEKVESKPKPNQETVVHGEAKGAPQALNHATEKVAAEVENEEGQKAETPVNTNQDELLVLLAHLAEAEAVIRGETQPDAVQMAELAEVMANSELIEAVQGMVVAEGNKLEAVKPVEAGLETPVINATESISSATGAIADNLKLNPETATEGKTAHLGQLNQVLHQTSDNSSQSEGESLFNQEQNPGAKSQISESVGITQNANLIIEGESQTFNKMVFGDNTLSKKVEADLQLGKDRVLAPDQSAAKSGKVDLAVIQTHLAVNDAPDAKTDQPVMNVISGQPSINNLAQTQTSGSTGVNSTNREELFSQMVDHAKVVINNGGSEMEVNLKPEHLGKLQLKVTIENEVVTARFVAESQQVKEIIESNLGQLKRNLQENGMQVDTIMVSVGNHQGSEGFEQAAYNREEFNSFKGTAGATNDDPAMDTEEPTPLAQHDTVIDLIA